jgi:hypothetical protein
MAAVPGRRPAAWRRPGRCTRHVETLPTRQRRRTAPPFPPVWCLTCGLPPRGDVLEGIWSDGQIGGEAVRGRSGRPATDAVPCRPPHFQESP